MAVAGKVAITLSTENGGAWSADVTYDRLVAVKHNNNLYISRKTVANVEPPNDEFWFLALEGFGGEDVEALIDRMNELSDLIQAIIDGTTQVGNAKTLDGHGAEYFAKAEINLGRINISESALDTFAKDKKITAYLTYIATIDPQKSDDGKYLFGGSRWTLIGMEWADYTYGHQFGVGDGTIKVRRLKNGTWGEWGEFLPLTGGKLVNDSAIQLEVQNNSGATTYIGYSNKDGAMGMIGFIGVDEPAFCKADWSVKYPLLHTGNKPTGTYTGNGEARTVNVGGVGSMVEIHSYHQKRLCSLVTRHFSICFDPASNNIVYNMNSTFLEGSLTLAADDMANIAGANNIYRVV